MGYMMVDGQRVEFSDEKNVLQVIRNAGIELPTFCYHSLLSVYGVCRMCVVEDEWGGIDTSCSMPPRDGMKIATNTPKLRKHRRMILELLLANHCRDCVACEKSGKCKLQDLAVRFGIREIRFGYDQKQVPVDDSSAAIVRNPNKCIMCGDCVRMCEEVQGIGVLGFAHRGSNLQVAPAFNRQLKNTDCVGCGQCTVVCPTGALVIKNDIHNLWKILHQKDKRVVAQIAPAVRVAIGEEFGFKPDESMMGRLTAALKKLGFDDVYDTALAADITVMEESKELLERLEQDKKLPLFTSCCPSWVRFAELKYPELLPHISTCRSPQQLFGAVIKEYYKNANGSDKRETKVVSIMPCTAKKYEAALAEYSVNGKSDVDVVITVQELAQMIKEAGIVFDELEVESLDMPFGLASGAGILLGVTGGVTEAVLRRCVALKTSKGIKEISFSGVRGLDGVKEAKAEIEDKTLRVAVVHGLKNAEKLIELITKSKDKKYDMVEVMACPGGCIGGAGQPLPQSPSLITQRMRGIYNADGASQIKRPEENPIVTILYEGILKGKHHLLHKPKVVEQKKEKIGPLTIHICVGSSCHLKGSYGVIGVLQDTIKKMGGEDKVEIKAALCLENCTKAVSVKINDVEIVSLSEKTAKPFFENLIREYL